ncbi:hypothetical protein OAU50_05430 [Planctomycetota bacterium]|nr:hypothetical protein [Planctomycetota bacterium]
MSDRKTFIEKLFKSNPDVKQLEVNRKVKGKYGKGISFVHIKALREAHKKGKYSAKYDVLCGDKPKAKKAAAKKATVKKTPAKAKTKQRGERRAKDDVRGRRDNDRNKILLKDFNQHLVVHKQRDGYMSSENFKSRKRAEDRVRSLISSGVSSSDIGYFRRSSIQTTVTL